MPDQLAWKWESLPNPSPVRAIAKWTPEALTLVQLIVPCHDETSMPLVTGPLEHSTTASDSLAGSSAGLPGSATQAESESTIAEPKRARARIAGLLSKDVHRLVRP